MPPRIATLARRYTDAAPAARRAELIAHVRDRTRRLALLNECPSPLDLAARYDPRIVRTPALELIAARVLAAATTRDGRLVLSIPPQEGKTTILRWAVAWLLVENPDLRIAVTSYATALARTSGRIVRTLIDTHGTDLGLTVDRSHADAADWQIAGHLGGLRAAGVGAGITGQPVDVLIVDDPIKDQEAADSDTIRGALHSWWESVALTRLAPGAPIIVVQTRWHEDDLAGRLAGGGWPVVNIPAYADGQTPDALTRPPGVFLVSARRRTDEDWRRTRAGVGERVWAALYQGRPAPLEGGVFQREWFEMWRAESIPAGCAPPVVVVDPADNPGSGDEAGIIVGASHKGTGRAYVIDDLSGSMTVAEWARRALLACVRYGAPTLAYEQSLSDLARRVRGVWRELHEQAVALQRTRTGDGWDIPAAVDRVAGADARDETRAAVATLLTEILDVVEGIVGMGEAGPRLRKILGRGPKQQRMMLVSAAVETGQVRLVGRHPVLEHQAVTWQEGQDSPDRVDAFVYLTALLAGISGVATLATSGQERVPTRSTGRSRAAARLTRSTRR